MYLSPTYRLHNANCWKLYIYVQYVPVLSHTDYILKNSRKGYICRYTECLKLCDMYLFTYRIHNTKQPRWPYICICMNHTKCLMKMLHYVPVLHTDYIMLNSRDGYTYVYVSTIRNVNEILHYVPVYIQTT